MLLCYVLRLGGATCGAALKARPNRAQGNALGLGPHASSLACKGGLTLYAIMGYNALSGLHYLEPIDTQGVALGCVGLAFQAGKSFAGWRLSAYAGDIPALHTRERPTNNHHILWPLALSG